MKPTLKLKGSEKLAKRLELGGKNMTDAAARAMVTFAGEIERQSNALIPVDTGEQRARSFVEGPLEDREGNYVVIVGYEKHGAETGMKNQDVRGDFYAVALHERTNVRHTNGQAKFLETAVKNAMPEYATYIAKKTKKAAE